jgi:hypothetical protein
LIQEGLERANALLSEKVSLLLERGKAGYLKIRKS